MLSVLWLHLSKKTDEIQFFADRKDIKKYFDALKTVYGPQSSGTTLLLSLLTDKEAILKRWAEHFDVSLIGHHLSMMKPSADYHRWNVIHCLINFQPSLKQWKQLNSCNLARLQDQIQYPQRSTKQKALQLQRNSGGPPDAEKLTELFHIMWRKEAIPQEFKDAFTYSNGNGILKSVKIIGTSLYCQLLGGSFSPTEPIERTPWTVKSSTRKPIWI